MLRKSSWWLLTIVMASGLIMGCARTDYRNTARQLHRIRLGMTPDEVASEIGKPTTIRAAKVYEDEQFATLWEYLPPILTLYPKTVWVLYENDRVVQFGEPGDFTTLQTVQSTSPPTAQEYKPTKGR